MVNSKYNPNITAEEIAVRDLSWFRGEIVVVEDYKTFRSVFPKLLGKDLLGFDTETRPTFKKGKRNKVSLIQLSTENLAVLFRINRIGLPEELIDLLSDPAVTKAGVAIHDDIRFLKGVKKFSPEGFIDLQSFVKEFGIESSGLKKITAIVLGFRISKRQQVTDWEAEKLTEAQQVYAATDAWVCHQIYRKLTNGREVRSA
ncbi:MAG TPA: 3'-5' exonuclease [Bacteroidales bacterium]|nr:3'-5' exonuclease [Bacteroidales bacterium]